MLVAVGAQLRHIEKVQIQDADHFMPRPYNLQDLADELGNALYAIKAGQLTLLEAKRIVAQLLGVRLTQELFPNESRVAEKVAAQLLIIQQLAVEFDQACERGASPGDKLGEVPCLDAVLQRALDESVAPLNGYSR